MPTPIPMCASRCIIDGADVLMIAGLFLSCSSSSSSSCPLQVLGQEPVHDAACWNLQHFIQTDIFVSVETLDTVFVYLLSLFCFGAPCMGCICHSEHSAPCSARCPATEREVGALRGLWPRVCGWEEQRGVVGGVVDDGGTRGRRSCMRLERGTRVCLPACCVPRGASAMVLVVMTS